MLLYVVLFCYKLVHIIFTKKGSEENDVIRNKEKQATIFNVERNKKMSTIFMHSYKCKSNTNATSASTNFLAINKSCYDKSFRTRDSTSDKELTYIECDNSFRFSSCFLGSARKSWSQIVLLTSLLPKNDLSIPPLSSFRIVPSPCNNRCYQENHSNCLSTYNVFDKITSSLPPITYHHSNSSRLEESRSVYLHNRQTSLLSGLFVDEKEHPHCRPNHMKKEKKYINDTNNTKNSNNLGHEHGH